MRAEQLHRFDLATGPLFRVALIKLGEREHSLLITMHHIVADGWSCGVLARELSMLYTAYVHDEQSPLPELPVQYGDYAIWQKDWLQGEILQTQLKYWIERLADAPSQLQLPADRPRPAVETFRGALLKFSLSAGLSQSLLKLAQLESATLFMVMLSAYQILLARYSGQEDVVVGSPIANRRNRAIEDNIGFFVNTIVLRTHVSSDLTFRQLLREVREITLGAYANQDMPFDALVKQLRPERNLTRQPLFQVWLALQNFPEKCLELPALKWTWVTMDWATSIFDLALYLENLPSGLSGVFEYATDQFDSETIERMSRHLKNLLDDILAHPDRPIGNLSMLDEAERHQIIGEWTATDFLFSHKKLIHQLFEEQVRRTPTSPAVLYEESVLTYSELNAKANRLARHLISKGVVPDQPVAICIERSLEMVIGLIGILKAGGAYVPIDPNYPLDRIQSMLEDAAPKIMITEERLTTKLLYQRATLIVLDRNWMAIEQHYDGNIDPNGLGLQPTHLAYVIYTSGSTGKPKGAMNEHRALINRLEWMQDEYRLDTRDRVLQKTPFSFDVSVWEFFWTLMTGAQLIIARPQGHQDPSYLMDLIEAAGVTTVHFVPSMLQLFLDQHSPGRCSSLRQVICSGEQLPVSLTRQFFESFPDTRLHNLYGPTEAAIDVTYWECKPDSKSPHVPIGRPIWNTQMYVVDSYLRPVAIGVQGNIYIGGVGVGRGYLNQQKLTDERFISDPFRPNQRGRLYKTGDLGRWRRDGAIDYLGRCDFQVKIRGFRIELGEIEAALMEHREVKQATVIAREGQQSDDKRLVAYIVGQKPSTSDRSIEELRTVVVDQWATLYEETYGSPENPAEPSFVGWNSSYTGQPIPEVEMQEWLATTIQRIQTLKPRRILEIGCGVGLLLQHLAPQCVKYVATDFSSSAIASLRHWVAHRKELAHVELLHRSATELEEFPIGAFDLIILNSVVQYFPDIDYFVGFLKGGVRIVSSGGHIFIGDVRHLGLLRTFHTAVQLAKAAAPVTVKQLRSRIGRSISQEKELLIDPECFRTLPINVPNISAVEVLLKRGHASNELTRYRYDVMLKVGDQIEPELVCEHLDWSSLNGSREQLELGLEKRRWGAIRLINIPNERLSADLAARALVDRAEARVEIGTLRHLLAQTQLRAVAPEVVWELASAYNYDLTLSPSAECETFNALLLDRTKHHLARASGAVRGVARPLHDFANDPLENGFRQQLILKLREHLKARLPEYMLPAAFVVLQQLPLTLNGKLDRRALPAPDVESLAKGRYEAPEGQIEQLLAVLWQSSLQVDQVGRDDNFFELGGHSLLAVRVLQRINSSFGCALRVVDLYQSPTVKQLAARIEGLKSEDQLVDLSREATLDAHILAPLGGRHSPLQSILLTGCTGFVGRFMLARLLEANVSKLFCLVRAQSRRDAASRLQKTLDRFGLWRDEFGGRIVPVCGDMTLPGFGLDPVTYRDVCQETDCIYHCAASMNHLETYSMAKTANVDSVREVLKIATDSKPKLVNYISTMGVFGQQYTDGVRVIDESTTIERERHRTSQGYVASKWVAEKILMIARERGIPCNIFRVGLVWGDSELGRYDELQREDRIFRSCMQSGFGIKKYTYDPPPTPVDYVARSVVWLATQHSAGHGVFHIFSSQPPVENVFERCNAVAGTSLKLLPLYDWICQLKLLHKEGRTLPAVPLIEFAFSMEESSFNEEQRRLSSSIPHFDCARTERELARGGLFTPEFTDKLLSQYVKRIGYEQALSDSKVPMP